MNPQPRTVVSFYDVQNSIPDPWNRVFSDQQHGSPLVLEHRVARPFLVWSKLNVPVPQNDANGDVVGTISQALFKAYVRGLSNGQHGFVLSLTPGDGL
jgi:hypothetical protein